MLSEFAEVAATTLVTAMTTSTWDSVRSAFSRVLGQDLQVRRELEAAAQAPLAGSRDEALEVRRWTSLIGTAIAQRPEAASLLQSELERIGALEPRAVIQSGQARRDLYNISGNVTINNHG